MSSKSYTTSGSGSGNVSVTWRDRIDLTWLSRPIVNNIRKNNTAHTEEKGMRDIASG